MTKRVKKNPKDKFERELWELWDALKRAMDKQEVMRGSPEYWSWIAEAAKYWNFLNTWESLVCSGNPARVSRAYTDWIGARGLRDWAPSLGILLWGPPPPIAASDTKAWDDWAEAQKAKTEAVNTRLRKWLDKGIAKHRKAKAKDAKRKANDRVHAQAGG